MNEMIGTIVDDINSLEITTASTVFKLILSMIFGSAVGYERKLKGQIAGVRTFSLICMGATIAMVLSVYVPQEYLGLKNGDPSRIAAQVVSGIGFLGAGAIIQMKGSVRGLTTAAGIWMIAAIGMAVGVGLYMVSAAATLLMLFVLTLLERIEHTINVGAKSRTITIVTDDIISDITPYREALSARSVHLTGYYVAYDYAASSTRLNLVVLSPDSVDLLTVFGDLKALAATRSISLSNQVST